MVSRRASVPLIAGWGRFVIGVGLLGATAAAVLRAWDMPSLACLALLWMLSVLATDKYRHKYPQRYDTYLLAAHGKALVIMLAGVGATYLLFGTVLPTNELLAICLIFSLVDYLVSLPRRPHRRTAIRREMALPLSGNGASSVEREEPAVESTGDGGIAPSALETIRERCGRRVAEVVQDLVAAGPHVADVDIVDRVLPAADGNEPGRDTDLLICDVPINDLGRDTRNLQALVRKVRMNGTLVGKYVPQEWHVRRIQERYGRVMAAPALLLHFVFRRVLPKLPVTGRAYDLLTRHRGRVMSNVEVWGRLSYCGMEVTSEGEVDGIVYFAATRASEVLRSPEPTLSPVIALEKVGLYGDVIYTHKIRTMYSYSPCLQRAIFESNGLAPTGKFANDYRITEYGSFLRKYWLDELPQIIDWLRGELKLFGMRATSPHYLGLYPESAYYLYVQTKPGLVPPIFDEGTSGLDDIVATEVTYLQAYSESPVRADFRYLLKTTRDIVIRGVRSK